MQSIAKRHSLGLRSRNRRADRNEEEATFKDGKQARRRTIQRQSLSWKKQSCQDPWNGSPMTASLSGFPPVK